MKNRKQKAVLSICAILLTGCGVQTAKTDTGSKHTPAKEDMVISASGSGDLMEWIRTFEDYLTLSDAIVYGEVSDFEMVVSEGSGFIHTLETINVVDALYGNIEVGTDLLVNEFGGYALISDVINAFETEEERTGYREGMFGNLTDKELNTKYISEVPEGYYYPEIGDRAIYCLKLINNMDGMYRIIGAWQGKYREIEEGILALPDESNSLSDPEKTYNSGTITYEELKEQILEAAGKLQEN